MAGGMAPRHFRCAGADRRRAPENVRSGAVFKPVCKLM